MIMGSVVDNVVYIAMMSFLLRACCFDLMKLCLSQSYGTISVVGLAMNCMAACKVQNTTTACYST